MSFKVETAQECCDACRAHATKCVDPAMAGQVYLRRRWGKQQIEERCAATMTSNEVAIGLGLRLGVGARLGLGLVHYLVGGLRRGTARY